jgi:SHS2 domain-containing protein
VRYEYPDEITSDQMFRAYGSSLSEVLVNAAMAMFGIMYDLDEIQIDESIVVKASGKTEERLLYNWLSNLLIEFEVEGVFFSEFTIDTFNRDADDTMRVTGTAKGSRMMPQIITQVKGVTLHRFRIEKTKDQYIATVVVDI